MPARRRLVPALFLVLLCLPLNFAAQTRRWRLASVRIQGSERLRPEQVAPLSELPVGEYVTLEDVQAAADRLAQLGLFDYVTYNYEATPHAISVTFVVEETAQFRPVEFDNFVWLPQQELMAHLKERIPVFTGLSPPGGFLIEEIQRVTQEILAGHGVQARVTYLPPMADEGGANVFRIEGVSIPVVSLEFDGADKLGSKKLLKVSQPLLANEYSRGFLSVFMQRTLVPLYRSEGYLRARIGDPQVEYLGEAEGTHPVRVVFPVDEGEVYRVQEIRWSGNQTFSTPDLAKRVDLKPGDVADTVQLWDDLEKIRREEYGRRGYIRAKFHLTPQLDDENLTATLDVNVQEGALFRFRELQIHGLTAQAAEWLTRRWKLRPGDPYDDVYASKFMKEDVGELMQRLTPRPATVNFILDEDEQAKTVAVVIRFR